jgi:hypothetical protein
VAPGDELIAMNTLLRLTLVSLALSLVGCASTDFQAIESQGPIVAQGVAGTRKVVDGVDIWTSGAPPRKYQVIGVIEDKRGGGILPMSQYEHDIAAKVRKAGGDGAIVASTASQPIGYHTIGGANTNYSGDYSGNVNMYGSTGDISGTYSGTANTSGYATTYQLSMHYGKFFVIKYL